MKLMNWIFKYFFDTFVILFIYDTLVYSKTNVEYEVYLRRVLIVMKAHKLYTKFLKCEF